MICTPGLFDNISTQAEVRATGDAYLQECRGALVEQLHCHLAHHKQLQDCRRVVLNYCNGETLMNGLRDNQIMLVSSLLMRVPSGYMPHLSADGVQLM